MQSYLLRSLFHCPVTTALLGPNNFINSLFSITLTQCFSLNMRDHDSQP